MSSSSRPSRRRLLKLGAGLAAAAPFLGSTARADAGEVVYATYGGGWEEIIRKAWVEPFTAKTGIAVRTVSGPSNGKVRAMVQAGHTEWDVVECNPDFQWIGAKEGLLEPLDFKVIDTSHFVKGADLVTDYSIPEAFWSRVITYSTKAFPNDGPRNFAEFWDVKRFPGKRTLYAKANGAALEAALMADGVDPKALYPLDLERAFKSLDKIRDHILWYDNNSQAMQYLQDGQAVLGLVPDGRAQFLIGKGEPLAIAFDQSLLTWVTYVVPKGAPNRDNAMKLLAHISSLEGQVAIGQAYTYGLVDERAYGELPPERVKLLTNGPQQQGKAVLVNERWWGENQAEVEAKFALWRLG
ncbi:MAG: ABC transporter substrate-binding protein [Zavarzinia sp.]|nr:ABC transporter substrate-binding protein [Zavarzinia sp.]